METQCLLPRSYHDIYNPNEIEMRNLLRKDDLDGTPAQQTEEICKWLVAMLLIAQTIVGAGTTFNWGRPSIGDDLISVPGYSLVVFAVCV
jgi:hypothetical protein